MAINHANLLTYIYILARDLVLWMAIGMLILRETQVNLIPNSAPCECELSIPASPQALQNLTNILYGDITILGNLMVQGCILWQQKVGVYQNSCIVYEEIGKECVHGIWNTSKCLCNLHWEGAICDRHDCFGHGIFELAKGSCLCGGNYISSTYCENEPSDSFCDMDTCYGICIDNTCVCNQPGELGTECQQCANPIVGNKKCPERTNWGIEYVNINTQYAVCGGGYVMESPMVLLIAGLNCELASCRDFHENKYTCCLVTNMSLTPAECTKWIYTPYNMMDFLTYPQTVFNEAYRLRYLNIIESHNYCIEEKNCKKNAYLELSKSDWTQLEIDQVYNNKHYIKLNEYSLGLGQVAGTFAEALWSLTMTPIYLEGTGDYSEGHQFIYIFYYDFPSIYCLAGSTNAIAELYVRPGLYWKNLREQPGTLLPKTYCGQYTKDLRNMEFQYIGSMGAGRAILQHSLTNTTLYTFH
jgi:hypothetical protein